ncbi:MAG: hypothetical protein AAFR84_21200 [Pseudomonadota bacterium]
MTEQEIKQAVVDNHMLAAERWCERVRADAHDLARALERIEGRIRTARKSGRPQDVVREMSRAVHKIAWTTANMHIDQPSALAADLIDAGEADVIDGESADQCPSS